MAFEKLVWMESDERRRWLGALRGFCWSDDVGGEKKEEKKNSAEG